MNRVLRFPRSSRRSESIGRRRRAPVRSAPLLLWLALGSSAAPPLAKMPGVAPAGVASQPVVVRPGIKQRRASRAWGTRPEAEPPEYVRALSLDAGGSAPRLEWLLFGLEQQTRFEMRNDDLRRPELTYDDQFLLRTRGYLGIREVLDPFRVGFEFQDSRQFGSRYDETDRDVNEAEILQLYGELYFRDALGPGQPVRFQAGRIAFELVDRRLLERGRWRNTTTSLEGARLRLGDGRSLWELNAFGVQPVERRLRRPDRADEERGFFGVTAAWRGWEDAITLEPYWFLLTEDRKETLPEDRRIHTIGLHAFGPLPIERMDYDFDFAWQFGRDGDNVHRAFAGAAEIGYQFEHELKPRLSLSMLIASGDRDPTDQTSERFDRLFGAAHALSTSDDFTWQNILNPKLRLDLSFPHDIRANVAFGGYWLMTDSDVLGATGRRPPPGAGANFIGEELEVRITCPVGKNANVELGFSHLFPGRVVRNSGDADDSDFFYMQTTLRIP